MYFRLPFYGALVTAGLVMYAWCGETTVYKIAAVLGVISLWIIRPNLTQAYED